MCHGVCAVALSSVLLAQHPGQEPATAGSVGRLRRVLIERNDVFLDAEAEGNWFFGLANALHFVTREEVVAREVWFRPGDELRREQVEELERNLRALNLFGSVRAETVPAGDGEVDLLLRTQDRFSLGASAGFTNVGGVQKVNFRLSEANLFGTGKQLFVSTAYGDEGRNAHVDYYDPQLFGSWHTLFASVGETEEGAFGQLRLQRPFRHLEDPVSYGVEFTGADEDVDYYRSGQSFAEVPLQRRALRLSAAIATGSRDLRHYLGCDLLARRRDYEPATGPGAGTVVVPGDTDDLEVGTSYAIRSIDRYERATGIDRIDYVEDLWLGVSGRLRLAAGWRDEDGLGPELQPGLGFDGAAALQPLPDTWLTLVAAAAGRWNRDGLRGWDLGFGVHAFQRSLPAQTLAGSFTFDWAGDRQDLTPQLTLGEDNGLRGYPAREFAGSRFARLNLENRIDIGLEVLSVHVGGVVFCDAGWVHDLGSGLSLGDPIRSVGLGLRFGSHNLFGDRILRLDVAWPLDEVQGQDYGMSISFGSGQVFTYFGNASELGSAF